MKPADCRERQVLFPTVLRKDVAKPSVNAFDHRAHAGFWIFSRISMVGVVIVLSLIQCAVEKPTIVYQKVDLANFLKANANSSFSRGVTASAPP
jgi:hypothetical protein